MERLLCLCLENSLPGSVPSALSSSGPLSVLTHPLAVADSSLLENFPKISQAQEIHGQGRGRDRSCRSQTLSWSQGRARPLGVLTPGKRGAASSWVPGDPGMLAAC